MYPKIHFLTLLGVKFDTDLFSPFVRFYLARKLDSYKVLLHSEDGYVDHNLLSDFRNAGFKTIIVDGKFSNGKLRGEHFRNIARDLPDDDFLVTADFDEFHCTPDYDPLDYRKLLREYDVLCGMLADRYSSKLENACVADFRSLLFQYSHEQTPWDSTPFLSFVPPWIKADNWPIGFRNKIIAARAGAEVNYVGSHNMIAVPHDARIKSDLKVVHFAWREASARKMATKSYFSHDSLQSVFSGCIPEEVEKEHFTTHKMETLCA